MSGLIKLLKEISEREFDTKANEELKDLNEKLNDKLESTIKISIEKEDFEMLNEYYEEKLNTY